MMNDSIEAKIANLSFKERVFTIVRKIPKSKTMTYKEVAMKAGRPLAFRAVGNALGTNYDPNIPCHRVIGSDGKMRGYNRGIGRKLAILKKEGAIS